MKIDIIRTMKLVAMNLLLSMAAFAVTVGPLPQSEFADTEVSTNIAFAGERPAMTRIEFTVALDATPTNGVEVAIGTDANGDGNLSVEESAYVFGYDCGKWFKRSQSESEVEQWNLSSFLTSDEGVASTLGGQPERGSTIHCSPSTSAFVSSSHTFVLKKRQLDAAWNLVKVTRRGCGSACELVEAKGRKPGFRLEVR